MDLPIKNDQLKVKVTPNSAKTEIKSIENNLIKINLNAPPENAQKSLAFLARQSQ